MIIEDKFYELKSASGKDVEKEDVLTLVIEEITTGEQVDSLFIKPIKLSKKSIRGWSILHHGSLNEIGQIIYDGKKIHFYNENSQEHIYIEKVYNPQIQYSDKSLGDNQVRVLNYYITNLCKVEKKEETPYYITHL